jgi:hypothetical protein
MGMDPMELLEKTTFLGFLKKKAPTPKTPGVAPIPVTPGEELTKSRKKYRPAAQVFKDEDLRLGAAGKLGL